MAVDTRNKRASAIGVGLSVALLLPLADGTVGQADRQQTAYQYSGIAAAVSQIVVVEIAGSYEPTAQIAGSSEPTVAVRGSYEPTVTISGEFP